jgi:sulfite exporter TauE/SafE
VTAAFLLAFSAGIFGGFGHCIGMCGPLVASYAFRPEDGKGFSGSLKTHLIYNAGRITTYSFIGSLMGLTGTFVSAAGRLAGFQNLTPVLAGLFMITAGLQTAGVLRVSFFKEERCGLISKAAKLVLEGESRWKYYPLGLLLGFMPCGLSYSVFAAAAGTGALLQGAALLFFFGIGTLPALLFFGSLMTYIGNKARGRLYKAGGVAVVLMGIFFFINGLIRHA